MLQPAHIGTTGPDLSLALLRGLVVAGGAGVVTLPLSVLPLVAAVAAPVVARLVFLLRTPVLLVGALVARLVFLNKISIKI
jgi:hypothetical protein